jgi:hypothetical protein
MTSLDPNEVARIEAIDFARRLVQLWQQTLGAELLGAYLIGRLTHGGFTQRYSDMELAIVTEVGLSRDALDRLKSEAGADRELGLESFDVLGRQALFSRPISATRIFARSNLYHLAGSCAKFCSRRNLRVEGTQDVPTDDPLSRSLLLQLDDRLHRLERRRRDVTEQKTPARARY